MKDRVQDPIAMSNPTSKYASQLQMLSPLFPDWDEDALASVLADTKGNAEEAALAITDGKPCCRAWI